MAQKHDFVISPVVYSRIHNDQEPVVSFARKGRLLNSMGIGLKVSYKNVPIFLLLQRDQNFEYVPYNIFIDQYNIPYSITQTWSENHIMLYYSMKSLQLV